VLERLGDQLSVVAVNLRYLADHAGLAELAESLRVDDSSTVPSVDDTNSAITPTQNPPAGNPELEGKTADELFDMLDALNKGEA
jgi:hypothetical protein